jgi:glycosyltransferase involved in cell wall biosynthesis
MSQSFLLLLDSIARGGAERSMLTLAVELARLGRLHSLVTLNSRGDLYELPELLRSRYVCLEGLGTLTAWSTIRRQLRSADSVTIFAALPRASLLAVCAAAGTGQGVITSQRFVLNRFLGRSVLDWLKKRFVLATHAAADGVICISRDVKDDLDRSSRALTRKTFVLYNPVATADAHEWRTGGRLLGAGSLAAAAGGEPLRLVSVGRLVPEKGFAELIDALVGLAPSVPVRLDVFGDGPERMALQGRITASGAEQCVRLMGFAADVESRLGDYDAFLFNSHSEGFGRALYEAYLADLPVLYPARLLAGAELLAGLPGAVQFTHCTAQSLRTGLEQVAGASRSDFTAAVAGVRAALDPSMHVEQFLRIATGVVRER